MRALRVLKSCCGKFFNGVFAWCAFVDMHLAKSGFVSVRFAKFTHFIKACVLSNGVFCKFALLTKHAPCLKFKFAPQLA